MIPDNPWLLPAAGLFIGVLAGAVARWNHFCTLSALERYWYANDATGLRTWILAAVVAMFTTQIMVAVGYIDITTSFYLRPSVSLVGSIAGGIMFGIGMALVGTCGFGALVRLGGGSLRSLIIVMAIGIAALATQQGVLSNTRVSLIEPLSIKLSVLDQSIPALLENIIGFYAQLPIALLITALISWWIFSSPNYRRQPRSIITGTLIGLAVSAGWVITNVLSDSLFRQVPIESATFVLPPGKLIYSLVAITGSIPTYSMGMVLGVILGSFLSSAALNDIQWEACDDARELSRHIVGGIMMGIGGVLAAGCTIGQGVSAFSTLAVSAPIVFLSICFGARIGLRVLIEGLPSLKQA